MPQVNLASVFELVNDVADDAAATIRGHRCLEVDRAMRTIRAGKSIVDGAFEWLRAGLAKWRDDPNELYFASIAEVLAGPDVFPADRACGRIQQRDGCLEQFRFVKRDHVLTIAK